VKKARQWSKREVETLRRLYGECLVADLARLLNRSCVAIFKKANKLGLRAYRGFRRGTEVVALREKGLTGKEAAEKLGLKPQTVYTYTYFHIHPDQYEKLKQTLRHKRSPTQNHKSTPT